MQPVILCAGLGTRLGRTTNALPKCLLEVGDRTLLDRQLEVLSWATSRKPRLVLGTKGDCWGQAAYDRIRERAVDLVFNFENDQSHNVYSMWLALRDLDPTDVLLIDGDLAFDEALLSRLIYFQHDNALLTSFAESERAAGTRVVVDEVGRVVELGKRIVPAQFPWQIHSGILKIGRDSFRDFVAALAEPVNLRAELEGAVSSFIRHRPVHTLCVSAEAWVNVNTPSDLTRARSLSSAPPRAAFVHG